LGFVDFLAAAFAGAGGAAAAGGGEAGVAIWCSVEDGWTLNRCDVNQWKWT
jgi:hypothetical protein